MDQNGKNGTEQDAPSTSHSAHHKTTHKRAKGGKSRVWEKVAWFTKRSRSKEHGVGATAASSESDLSGLPLENMDFEISPSGSCYDSVALRSGQPPWIGSSSSTDSAETFQEELLQDGYRVKRSRLYPNSEVIEQHCLKPSVARALFHQMEAASCRTGKGPKYAWQTKKKKRNHSIPWYNVHTEDSAADDGLERTVSMPAEIMSASQCHCSACCTCTPTQRLMGMCPAHARLSTSTTSLDTGLTLSAASCAHDTIPVCANQDRESITNNVNGAAFSPNTSFDDHDVTTQNHVTSVQDHDECSDDESIAMTTTTTHSDMLTQFKSNSLPMYFSKRCKLCNKPQTSKVHLPRYPHVPNMTSQFCSCNVQNNQPPTNHAAQSASCSAPYTNATKPLPEVVDEEPVKYQRDKVDALEYKEKRQMMKEWFSQFNDEQKNLLLKDLLEEECDLPQIHLLSIHMSPRLHQGCPPNCSDILTWLPSGIANHILSYLDPVSLCRASMVCKVWHQLANDVSLWRCFCSQPKWQLSRGGEQKQLIQHMLPNGNIHWKAVFSERFRLRNNWLKGRCNVRTFEGHTQGVSCVQFDDTRIVSGSSDKTIKVWNIRTNTPWSVQTLVGHSGTVRCLHLEGNRLVSGSTDKTIKVWDLSTQHTWSSIACKVTMVGHTDTVRCLQVDDEKVVSGSYDKTLKVWDIRSGRCRMTLRGHDAAVLCVQFDEAKIVSGSCDKTIKLWTFEGACVMTLPGHHDAVTCLQFDDMRIVSGSLDCNLKFWDVHTGACNNTIDWKASEGHTGVVRCLQADSWRVVSASDDRTLKVWSLETGQRLVTLRNHTDGVTCLQFNDSFIVSGSYDKTVKLWDFTSC